MRLSENDEVVKTCLHMFKDCITVYTKQNLLKIINYAYEAGKRDKTDEKKNIDSTSTILNGLVFKHGGAIKHERKNN